MTTNETRLGNVERRITKRLQRAQAVESTPRPVHGFTEGQALTVHVLEILAGATEQAEREARGADKQALQAELQQYRQMIATARDQSLPMEQRLAVVGAVIGDIRHSQPEEIEECLAVLRGELPAAKPPPMATPPPAQPPTWQGNGI